MTQYLYAGWQRLIRNGYSLQNVVEKRAKSGISDIISIPMLGEITLSEGTVWQFNRP